jgi:predicted permease
MPPGFDVEDAGVELWLPLALDPANPGGRGNHYLYLVGRLKEGTSLGRARQELSGMLARWREEFPDTHVPSPDRHALVIQPLKEDLVGASRPAMLVLAGAVGLVLLIACANVANLLLARAEARQREVAVRTALGAGRGRLLAQFLTESVVLSLAGGALGLALAIVGVNAVLAANPDSVVRVDRVALDGRILAFTLLVSLATGLVFGLAPALHVRARSFFASLREGARSTAGRGRRLFRSGLVVAEVALAALLVVGAGLLLRSFWALQRVETGFDPRGVLTFQLALPEPIYPKPEDAEGFYQRLAAGLTALPGVEAVATMTDLPPKRDVDANDTEFEGVPGPPEGPIQNVDYYQFISPGYFEAMRIPVVKGRAFVGADATSETAVAVVSRRLAQVFWPDQDPIGKRLRPDFGPEIPWFSVVGVVGDVKEGGLNRPAGTELYLLADQLLVRRLGFGLRTRNLVVRTAGDPLALASSVRAEVRRLDPALPVAGLQPLARVVRNSLGGSRFLALLVGVFGAAALMLAAVGTYGVLSYAVEERRHEMGVRLALGAAGGAVLGLVLRQGMRLAGAGLAAGLVGALALRRVIASVLFETAPTDPVTFGGVAALLAGVALFACWLPARRAMRVDPMVTLRSE